MTASAIRKPTRATTERPSAVASSGNALADTATLVRFVLRRDRIKLPVWLLGMVVLLSVLGRAVSQLTETAEQRQDLQRVMDGAVGAIFGPGYGRFDITADLYVTGVYGLFLFVLAALMSILLVCRHTRVEEQDGRAELIRSNVVGRHAQLTATLIVAVGANAVLALLLGGTMVVNGFDGRDGLLFGSSVGAVGLVFAGITSITVQVTEHSRVAAGMAGAALGVAWAVRAAGDMITDHGSALSWFSPLAWSNQTRPYVDGRWWPLLLSIGLAAATAAAGYVWSARRDVGAGLVVTRRGEPVAAPWLRSPFAVAFRLQRAGLIWWTASLATFGFVFGALGDQIADPEDMSEGRLDMFGGSLDTLLEGYLGVITLFTAALASVMTVLGVQAARTEETKGRAEPVLATATSRSAWIGSHLAVLSIGLVGLLLVVGFTTGIGAAISVGDASHIWDMTVASLAHAPGVLVVLGIAGLLFGLAPRGIGATWVVVGFGFFVGLFGAIMDLPRWAHLVSPLDHTGRPPLDDITWSTAIALLVVAAALAAAGMAGFRRRDLQTK